MVLTHTFIFFYTQTHTYIYCIYIHAYIHTHMHVERKINSFWHSEDILTFQYSIGIITIAKIWQKNDKYRQKMQKKSTTLS